MPPGLERVVIFAEVSAVAAALLWWGRLPGPWRRALAVLTSGLGVLFLVGALRAEGHRESATMAVVVLGPAYVTEQASASASLPYYVMTGVCLLLGTAGLAVSDATARRLGSRWMATAIVLSLLVTATRFALDKAAAPPSWTRPIGVTWLPPIVGAFFVLNAKKEGRGLRNVAWLLLAYGFAVRGAVALLSVLATTLRLGSHYDVSNLVYIKNPMTTQWHEFAAGSFEQLFFLTLLPQLVFWPIYTVAAGMIGAVLALRLVPRGLGPRVPVVGAGVGMAPAQPEP
ncbi:MAG TPA: hypothetical protein VNH43_09025 [Vicinamibacteria bacterium]|nr:hypothetical protein [Vicinamibacteria bacterium]